MTYAERIVDFLWAIAPGGATNGEIARRLGIASQQTVYRLTRDLAWRGFVLVPGVELYFLADDGQLELLTGVR